MAFANTSGGILLIGVRDKTKEIVGVPNSLHEEERIANAISDSVAPLIIPDIEIHAYRDRENLRSDDLFAKIHYKLAKIFRNIIKYSEKFLRAYRGFIAAKHPDHRY